MTGKGRPEDRSVCFSGHRDIPEDKVDYVRQELRREIEAAIEDGFEYFTSGFADGADLMATEIVLELQEKHPYIRLAAAIPYRNRYKKLYENAGTQKLLLGCGTITICSEEYAPNCFLVRNRFMLDLSSRLVAVYDKRYRGGTAQTIRLARARDKEIHIILI